MVALDGEGIDGEGGGEGVLGEEVGSLGRLPAPVAEVGGAEPAVAESLQAAAGVAGVEGVADDERGKGGLVARDGELGGVVHHAGAVLELGRNHAFAPEVEGGAQVDGGGGGTAVIRGEGR